MRTRVKLSTSLTLLLVLSLQINCSDPVPLTSEYPMAMDVEKVGEYPVMTKSGGGYFYDDVLEYRVWVHDTPDDWYLAFPTFETALEFSEDTPNAEVPLVLVLQREWINESEVGEYSHERGERLTEWRVEWLEGHKREPGSIDAFLANPTPAD